MPRLLMTDRQLPGLVPIRRATFLDTHTPGLALRVSGATERHDGRARVWYFLYRLAGKREALKLGTYPALTLKEAREAAKTARRRLDDGENPAATRRTPAPAVYTFAHFVPVFVEVQKNLIKGWRDQENKIKKHLLPAWGDRPLASITRRDVAEVLDALIAGGMRGGTTGIKALISRIFTIALDRELVEHHPAARVMKRFPGNPGQRKLSDEELRALEAGLDAQPGAASDAMRLRLLLGQRGAETAGMLWSEIDLVDGVWSLPRTRTKNKQPHVIGLPPRALGILDARRAALDAAEPRVFPGLKLTGDAHKALAVIHGGTYEWKDIRRTVATRLGDLGISDSDVDRIQNRKQYSVGAVHYNHAKYVDMIRDALTQWEEGLARIRRGEPMIDRGKVIRMAPRGGAR
jgi:integrase